MQSATILKNGVTCEHGGNLDDAIAKFGGLRDEWIDLSTGINPVPYDVQEMPSRVWADLPDRQARQRLLRAARTFWNVPKAAEIVSAAGVSALIARMPSLVSGRLVHIPHPTYSEHEAAFRMASFAMVDRAEAADARVYVHPNNPDGRMYSGQEIDAGDGGLTIVDESFCDLCPQESHVSRTYKPGILVLKGIGKFWGLAGMRLGFAIGLPETLARPGDCSVSLARLLGPWPVSGPAMEIGSRALSDPAWAQATRGFLREGAQKLDRLVCANAATVVGGTDLFRLYRVNDAAHWQERLAEQRIWTRTFAYSRHWIRLGIPHPTAWDRFIAALERV